MAHSLLVLAVLVVLAGSAVAQAPGPGRNTANFGDISADDLTFRYNLPTDAAPSSSLQQSNATSLAATREPRLPLPDLRSLDNSDVQA